MLNKQTYIIAEAGVNHNGSIETAKKMIEIAVQCGANAIKFQTFKAENIVCLNAKKAEYQQKTTEKSESQFEMLKKLELSTSAHNDLISYCRKLNIDFLSTPFDFESIDLLNSLGLKTFKIPSGEITNLPYLRRIGQLNKEVILSSGMASLEEVKFAYHVLVGSGTKHNNITILHANTEYPTPFKDVNLNAMLTIKKELSIKVGYSDHTQGIEIPIAAVALGATVIEKHFTLDKALEGPDHKASLEPNELLAMVKAIRNIEESMGNGIKVPSNSEQKNISIARKSIVAAKNISYGEIFTENNITVKRPGTGVSPLLWDEVLGIKATKNYIKDELIRL